MSSPTLHDIASSIGARLIGVECQHCIRRGVLTAEALKARAVIVARLRRLACTVASVALAALLQLASPLALPHSFMRNHGPP
jgi:hypothetical protein